MTPEYDKSLKRLEEIIKQLELSKDEDEDLSTALSLYAEGKELVAKCERILNGQNERQVLRCPYVDCSKPMMVEQTSFGGNYEDFTCGNSHDFALVRHPIQFEYVDDDECED